MHPVPKGRVQFEFHGQIYDFEVKDVQISAQLNGDQQITVNGTKSRNDQVIYSAGTGIHSSFTIPMSGVNQDFVDLVTGRTHDGVVRENLKTHPDGSESWTEVKTDPAGLKRMRTVFASEWSDGYLIIRHSRCSCCTCGRTFEGALAEQDVHCPTHGTEGARPCRAHNSTGETYSEDVLVGFDVATGLNTYREEAVMPQSVEDYTA